MMQDLDMEDLIKTVGEKTSLKLKHRFQELEITKSHDPELTIRATLIKRKMRLNNDDHLTICIGKTGSGKSSLTFWFMEEFLQEKASVEYVGLDPKDYATSLGLASKQNFPKMVVNDEANISRRRHASQYNNDMIDLYFSIRGDLIYHWWNNPSLQILDKVFIEERVNDVYYISTKGSPYRYYYYFLKEDILKMLKDKGNVSLPTLETYAKDYCTSTGFFKKYTGKLWEDYLNKKEDRIKHNIAEFVKKYGHASHTQAEVARKMGVSETTVYNYYNELLERGDLVEEEDYFLTETNKRYFRDSGVQKLIDLAKEKHS